MGEHAISGSSYESPSHFLNPEKAGVPATTKAEGMLIGPRGAVNYFVVEPESPSLRGKVVNSYVPGDLSRLVVSADLDDRPSSDLRGKTLPPPQSSKMHQFLARRERDRIRAAEKRGTIIPPKPRPRTAIGGKEALAEFIAPMVEEAVKRILATESEQ